MAVLSGLLSGCFESPPQIIALDPPRGSVGVPADAPIVVQFDRPVVPASVIGRVSIRPALSGCDLVAAFTDPLSTGCRAVWTSGDTTFVLQHPRAIFEPLTTYGFRVSAGVRAPDGVENAVDHSWNLTTGSAPQVRSVTPADGTRGVPVDTVVTVAFSGGMSPAVTDDAIRLEPPVPGTRVVRNSLDASRFVLFPGRLLRPATRYTLTIASTAADQHHQPLAAPLQTSFTTGVLGTGGHAVVLAARRGEPPTQVRLTALAPTEAGVPVPDALVLEAPRCNQPGGCGAAPTGSPLLSYEAATLSPGGRWLAAVERDLTAPAGTTALVVLDVAGGTTVTTIAGGRFPAWSPDGTTLAYATGADVALLRPGAGPPQLLPPGDALVAPPVWGPRGELLVLAGAAPGRPAHLELGDAVVQARYPLPGAAQACTDPEVSPDGSQLAVLCNAGAPGAAGTWITPLGGSSTAPRLLGATLSPVGYAETGILVAVARPYGEPPRLVRVNVDSGDQLALAHQPTASTLGSVVISAVLRRLAFLAPDARGALQADVESVDGSTVVAVTGLPTGMSATAVVLSD